MYQGKLLFLQVMDFVPWRRLQQWEEQGVWLRIWRKFLSELEEQKQLEWEETFADGSFASAKKGSMRRQDQTWKRYEVDGGGRWPGSPYRCSSRFGLAE